MSKKVEKVSTGKRAGKGSHGSITKAGKVRGNTIIIPKTSTKKSQSPLRANRRRYERMLNESRNQRY